MSELQKHINSVVKLKLNTELFLLRKQDVCYNSVYYTSCIEGILYDCECPFSFVYYKFEYNSTNWWCFLI
jgi:hypothetical protein